MPRSVPYPAHSTGRSTRSSMRSESISPTLSATTSETRNPAKYEGEFRRETRLPAGGKWIRTSGSARYWVRFPTANAAAFAKGCVKHQLRSEVRPTPRWSKPDANSRSLWRGKLLPRGGKGTRGRSRWSRKGPSLLAAGRVFESISLQQRVRCKLNLGKDGF